MIRAMHSKWTTLALSVLLILVITYTAFDSSAFGTATLENSFKGDIKIFFNDKLIHLANEPIYYSGGIFIPAKDAVTLFGMYFVMPDEDHLIFYKSNTYMKLTPEEPVGYINGHATNIVAAPFYSNNTYYVPLDFFSKAFDLNTNWKATTGRYDISDLSDSEHYAFSNKEAFFKKIFIDDYGVNISIPTHWERLDKKKFSYGFIDDFEHFAVTVDSKKLSASTTLSDFEKTFQKQVLESDPAHLTFKKLNKKTATFLDSYAVYFTNKNRPSSLTQVSYLYVQDKIGYSLTFTFNDAFDEASAQTILDTIAASFQINKLTIDERSEHYVEYANYFDSEMTLDPSVYSNEIFSNYFNLKGTIRGGVDALRVIVSKEPQSLEFIIPVKNRHFDSKIYLPFGLGKHNIYIEAMTSGFFKSNEKDPNFEPIITYDEENLMQFSVINVSSKEIRYLIPTVRIQSDAPALNDLSKLITYKESGQFKKARAIYLNLSKAFEYDNDNLTYSRDCLRVIKDEKGNEEELTYLYAALLRSIDIPARVVQGTLDNETHYWAEVQLNGKWIVSDLGSEYTKGDGITAFFNLPKESYYSSYKNIKVQDF